MTRQVGSRGSYSKLPSVPHVVDVTLVGADFTTITRRNQNAIAAPDAFVPAAYTGYNFLGAPLTGYVGNGAQFDISSQMRAIGMEFVQTVFIDNSMGAGVCILRRRGSVIGIRVAPYTQGYYPLVVPEGTGLIFDVAYIDPLIDGGTNNPSFSQYPDNSAVLSGEGGLYRSRTVESGALNFQSGK